MTIFTNTLIANLVIWLTLIWLIFLLRIFKKQLIKYLWLFTAITVGILLGIILLWFIPEIISSGLDGEMIWIYILIGLLVFYILELVLHHHHCKDLDDVHHDCSHSHTTTQEHKNKILMFAWTFLHNVLHGIVLFSAFAINTEFGIATTIAVLLHSIPQNTANYIMNHNRESYVLVAALWGVIWALTLFPFTAYLMENEFVILSIISWALLYLALSDILPEVKNKWWLKTKLLYLLFIIIWLWLVLLLNHH